MVEVEATMGVRGPPDVASFAPGAGGRVLQLSMRRVHDLVAFCAPYELEDVVAAVTGADRVEILDYRAVEMARRVYKLTRKLTRSTALARVATPRLRVPRLSGEYDLFFPVFNHPFELFALAAVPDWRARSRVAACLVSEIWIQELPEYLIELLAQFDHLYLAVQHPVAEVARIVGKPCTYLPLGADVCRFAPYIGRRSAVTHQALLQLARDRRIFYFYDTVRATGKQMTFSVGNPAEHRFLLASLLQRTRYYVAYRSRVNEPEQTEGREEISGRFYEGAAAGAVLLGEPPRLEEFQRQFDWPDAVIRLPFDAPDIGGVLAALDADPGRLERARAASVHHSALRHDWLWRVHTVFRDAGLPLTEGMRAREQQLRRIGELALAAPGDRATTAARG
jgi:hypothetical protein